MRPEAQKGLTAPYNSPQNRIATLKFVQDIPLTPADPAWEVVDRVDKRIHRLNQNQVLFCGEQKILCLTPFLDEFLRRLPDGQSHVYEDAGHYLFEDKPEQTADRIHRFLVS